MPPKGKGKKKGPDSGWRPGFGTKGKPNNFIFTFYVLHYVGR